MSQGGSCRDFRFGQTDDESSSRREAARTATKGKRRARALKARLVGRQSSAVDDRCESRGLPQRREVLVISGKLGVCRLKLDCPA
jgi:hypothetical protein